MLNAFTVDFEDWYQGLEIPHQSWKGYESRIEASADRLLGLLAEAGVRGTFFVLGHVAENHPKLVRDIAAAGHEVGTHGYGHAFVYEQTPGQFRTEMTRCLRTLEDQTGRAVIGHRAPFFSITKRSIWALDVLLELGIRYDSSVFPVLNYRYGIPDAPRFPYEISLQGSTLVEFPITTLRLLGRNVPVAGGAYFRIYPYLVTKRAFRSLNRAGKAAVFYLHPWEVDPDHPRISLPRRVALTHYANLASTEGKLRRLLGDFRFAPMKEVLNVG